MSNHSLNDQLATTFNRPKRDSNFKYANRLPAPGRWQEDGVDHLNVSFQAATELGQTLFPNTTLPFKHDRFGTFESISAFWAYLETGATYENLRTMNNFERPKFMRNKDRVYIKAVSFFVADAMWQKLKCYPVLLENFKNTTLPFDMYYYDSDTKLPTRKSNSLWTVESLEIMRAAAKAGEEPDFWVFQKGEEAQDLFYDYIREYIPNNALNVETSSKRKNALLAELMASRPTSKFQRRAKPLPKKAEADAVVEDPAEVKEKDEANFNENLSTAFQAAEKQVAAKKLEIDVGNDITVGIQDLSEILQAPVGSFLAGDSEEQSNDAQVSSEGTSAVSDKPVVGLKATLETVGDFGDQVVSNIVVTGAAVVDTVQLLTKEVVNKPAKKRASKIAAKADASGVDEESMGKTKLDLSGFLPAKKAEDPAPLDVVSAEGPAAINPVGLAPIAEEIDVRALGHTAFFGERA